MTGTRKIHQRHSKVVTRTKRWKALRMVILERDGFKCRTCGLTGRGGRLEVDHIKPVRTHPDLSFEPGNLQALCTHCHSLKTRLEVGFLPTPKPVTDWRDAVAAMTRGDKKTNTIIKGESNA